MTQPRRDIMAPDNEPTDEELALVMREALAVAMTRRAASDEWMRRKLAEAVREAAERPDPQAMTADLDERPRLLIVAGPNGRDPALLLRASEGRIVKAYATSLPWMEAILAALAP